MLHSDGHRWPIFAILFFQWQVAQRCGYHQGKSAELGRRTVKRVARSGEVTGFTLIEIAIVLAIVAILSTVVVPDFIEVARNDLAKQASREMSLMIDTAKWYYANSGTWQDGADYRPDLMRWPGDFNADGVEDGANAAERCLTGQGAAEIGPPPTSVRVNCDIAHLPRTALNNPWGRDYEVDLVPATGGFRIRTNVPSSVSEVIRQSVPGGECETAANGGNGAPTFCPVLNPRPAGFVTCCATIPRPGREASFQEMVNVLSPGGSASACERPQDAIPPVPVNGRRCPEGYVNRGIDCSGKDCSNPQPRCCRTLE